MSQIGGPPPRKLPPAAGAREPERPAGAGKPTPAPLPAEATPIADGDHYERREALARAVEMRRPTTSGAKSTGGPRFVFSSEDMEYLNAFFVALREQPQASRKRRAQMLVEAILKRKGLARLLAHVSGAEREAMAESIAEALDTSPRYAQLVDTVSEGPEH